MIMYSASWIHKPAIEIPYTFSLPFQNSISDLIAINSKIVCRKVTIHVTVKRTGLVSK